MRESPHWRWSTLNASIHRWRNAHWRKSANVAESAEERPSKQSVVLSVRHKVGKLICRQLYLLRVDSTDEQWFGCGIEQKESGKDHLQYLWDISDNKTSRFHRPFRPLYWCETCETWNATLVAEQKWIKEQQQVAAPVQWKLAVSSRRKVMCARKKRWAGRMAKMHDKRWRNLTDE